MRIGDPKKVGALAVVALVAVAFLASQLMNGFKPVQLKSSEQQDLLPRHSEDGSNLPATLISRPFSHPALGNDTGPRNFAEMPGLQGAKPIDLSGPLANAIAPGLGQGISGISIQPENVSPSNRQSQPAVNRLSVTLHGILELENETGGGTTRVALVSVEIAGGKAEMQRLKAGDELIKGVRVRSIGQSAIELEAKGKVFRLGIGEKKQL